MSDSGVTIEVSLTVNGERRSIAVEPRHLLSDVLRHRLGLTGTHVGCEHGVCGCCTVLLDGAPVRSCLLFAVQVDGAELTTVEGLETPDRGLHPLQAAFQRRHALQCGFCTPGFLMALLPTADEAEALTDDELREVVAGQLCRCTGYTAIVDALRDVTREARGA
jgi:carbon-monoxide dehydrogenase small subunit